MQVKVTVVFWLVSLVLLDLTVFLLSRFFWCVKSRKTTLVTTNQSMGALQLIICEEQLCSVMPKTCMFSSY